MGVPSFFRWLVKKYPKVVTKVIEDRPTESADGQSTLEPDYNAPNPNGFEIDCLYLDMNGIIHPCCHPEDSEAPPDEPAMIKKIFEYIDRIVGMVRPRRLLYMAIDGVAPRAKMNQQRSRRFRAAKETRDREMIEEKVRGDWAAQGRVLPPKKRRPWDSNVITPGTPFMDNLSKALHYYIAQQINSAPHWKDLVVVFSDAKVPGEGEHKIMHFIRNQRAQPDYNANTRHCLYGMDADLIMLGLASHDPHFKIIREEVTTNVVRRCELCGQEGHYMSECTGEPAPKLEPHEATGPSHGQLKPFEFLHINVLREYLAHDLFVPELPFAWDLERAIDDFVLMAITVGNDFLPHLPSLEIREQALERLVSIYKRLLPSMGGYMTEPGGTVNLSRIDLLLTDLGTVEDAIFKQRKKKEVWEKKRHEDKKQRVENEKARRAAISQSIIQHNEQQGMVALGHSIIQGHRKRKEMTTEVKSHRLDDSDSGGEVVAKNDNVSESDGANGHSVKTEADSDADTDQPIKPEPKKKRKVTANKSVAVKGEDDDDSTVKEEDSDNGSVSDADEEDAVDIIPSPLKDARHLTDKILHSHTLTDTIPDEDFASALNLKLKEITEPAAEEDRVRFGEDGWKDRYYAVKMRVDPNNDADLPLLKKLFLSYTQGLAWVMSYYYDKCRDWAWYYPFHYAPLASDLKNLDEFAVTFDSEATAFTPVAQLMGVLPSDSAHAVPEVCRPLMCDPDSPIADFYPTDFPLDLNGKRFLWQAVALLPWIDEKRLLVEVSKAEPQFTPEEKSRNSEGYNYLFVHFSHPLANHIYKFQHSLSNTDEWKSGHAALRSLLTKPLNDSKKERQWAKVNEVNDRWLHPERSETTKHLKCERITPKYTPLPTRYLTDRDRIFGSIGPYVGAFTRGHEIAAAKELQLDPITGNKCLSAVFELINTHLPHQSALLPGLTPPPAVLTERDFRERREPRFGEGAQFWSNNNTGQPNLQSFALVNHDHHQLRGPTVDPYGPSGYAMRTQYGGTGYNSHGIHNNGYHPPPPPMPMYMSSQPYGNHYQHPPPPPPQAWQPQSHGGYHYPPPPPGHYQQSLPMPPPPSAPFSFSHAGPPRSMNSNPYASLAYGQSYGPPPLPQQGGRSYTHSR